MTAAKVCSGCALRERCTRSRTGRTVHRHEHQDLLDRAREQARGDRARADRRRRQHLVEGSFADAANNHGFKRSRWRRLWRQQIQDWLIAAVQNWRILLRERDGEKEAPGAGAAVMEIAANVVVTGAESWEGGPPGIGRARSRFGSCCSASPEIGQRESHRDAGGTPDPEMVLSGAE